MTSNAVKEAAMMRRRIDLTGRTPHRGIFLLIIALAWPGSQSVVAYSQLTPDAVVRTVSSPPALTFSSPPSDAELIHSGLFVEPLLPVANTTPIENEDLALALLAFRKLHRNASGDDEALEPMVAFLTAHPASAWTPALQLNLGIIYRKTGHFSKALDIWQSGWQDAKALSDPKGRAIANAILARLSQLEAYLGRKELLEPLLDSVHARPVGGTAAQLITDSYTGLYEMTYHPDSSFRCGPLALLRILQYVDPHPSAVSLRVLQEESPSTDHGLSLVAVEQIASRAGMKFQAAYRSPGAPMIVPAVAHWKVGHYAAIVDRARNGHYLVQDTTFGEDISVSPSTLDEESSGYFLIPAGPLPAGWRHVSLAEGSTIWGQGTTGQSHDGNATNPSNTDTTSTPPTCGGCTINKVELEVVGLELDDEPVGYHPPVGPDVRVRMTYSHRDTQQPSSFTYTNFGPKWTFNWLSYLTLWTSTSGATNFTAYLRGGGAEPFTNMNITGSPNEWYPGPYSQATLTPDTNGGYELTYPDGSQVFYDYKYPATNPQYFMSAMTDPAGNAVTLQYTTISCTCATNGDLILTTITDAIGQVTTINYQTNSPVVSSITDPFGRTASFAYNPTSPNQLTSITDVLGIQSQYVYSTGSNPEDPDFISQLITPYGTTQFSYGDVTNNPALGSTRFLKTIDPLSRTSYVEFDQQVDAGDSSNGILISSNLKPIAPQGATFYTCNSPNTSSGLPKNLNVRNTFVFDPNQYAQAAANGSLNYSLGRVIHWLHTGDNSSTSQVPESEKQPLENRVWYNYYGQVSGCSTSWPSPISFPVSLAAGSPPTVLANGASNKPIAIARVLDDGQTQFRQYVYGASNGTNFTGNLTQYTDPVGRVWNYVYESNGIDLNTTSNGSQLLETRTYNTQHLPLSIMGTNGRTTQLRYNAFGQLTRYIDPLGHATALTYDGAGHLKTITGANPSSVYSFTYDHVSRVESVTDPVDSTTRFNYDAADRPTTTFYPDGTTSINGYTLLDRTSITDRLSQKTRYQYDADRELQVSIDPAGNRTQLGYNPAGRVNSMTDPNGHTTTWGLDDESRVTSKQYPDGTTTSTVYQNAISLVATATDALQQTTSYTYNDDNSLATESYAATQPTASVSFTYDPDFPRLTTMTDGNGTTTYNYYPITSGLLGANQLQSVTSPVAGTSNSDTAVYSYDALNRVLGYSINGIAQSIGYDNIGRLASASNALDSNFVYNYSDGTSRITSVTSNNGPSIALTYFPATGSEFELLNTLSYTPNGGGTALQQFTYAYYADSKVNSLAVTTPSALTTTYNYDPANRLTSAPLSTGSQYTYGYDHASNLTSIAPPSGSGSPQSYTYTSTNGITSATYDANGSPTLLGTNLYKWDGANRVILFSNTASNIASRFVYDGFGRLVRVVDIQSGAITADHSYTWCGSMRCVAHDNTQSGSPVSTQYFPQGVIVSGTSYYYVQDQLGSVTELVTSGGSVAVQYTYDPYGNRTTASGTAVSDIGYAGYFYHAASGLDFTLHRAYDPVHARWLNRDPIGETGGVNLYAYTNGNPVSNSDPTGLIDQQTLTFGGLFPSPSEAQGFAAQQAAAATQSQIATEVVNSVLPLSAGITVTVPTGQWLVPTAAVFRYRHDANGTMCSIGWGARAGSGNATSYRPSVAYSATSFGDTGGLGWTNSVSTPAIAGPFGYSATSTIFFDGAYSSSHGPAIVGGQWSASSVLSYTVSW